MKLIVPNTFSFIGSRAIFDNVVHACSIYSKVTFFSFQSIILYCISCFTGGSWRSSTPYSFASSEEATKKEFPGNDVPLFL